MTDEADDWGANEPLKHPHLNLLGPTGKKRRRLSKSFKDAVGLQAMADKRSNTVSGMLKAVAPEMQEQSHRITHEMLWEHKAATEHLALVPHAPVAFLTAAELESRRGNPSTFICGGLCSRLRLACLRRSATVATTVNHLICA